MGLSIWSNYYVIDMQWCIWFDNTRLICPGKFLRIEIENIFIISHLWGNYWNFFIDIDVSTIKHTTNFG